MKAALKAKKVTVDPSLKLYIPFNEGTGNVAKDYSQYGNNGVLTDVEWGIHGGVFNGTSAYANCGNDSSLDTTDAIAIEAWVKLSSTAANYYERIVVDKWDGTPSYNGYVMRVGDAHLNFLCGDGSEAYNYRGGVFSLNEWHYLVVTIVNDELKGYIDGSYDDVLSVPSVDLVSTVNLGIGVYELSSRFFNGSIDGVKIYNRLLSALEILNDYEAERGRYEV